MSPPSQTSAACHSRAVPNRALVEAARQRLAPVAPDLLLIGGMKCGTTTLHEMLDRHPGIAMATGELSLLALDDVHEQPQNFADAQGNWVDRDLWGSFETYAVWYAERRGTVTEGLLCGDDAPSYLSSTCAAERAAALFPRAKLIVSLRDPTARAVSHYWHDVRRFRAVLPPDLALRQAPGTMLSRSFYASHLERWLRHVPRERMHVVLFEDLVADQAAALNGMLAFLAPRRANTVHAAPVSVHANAGRYPRHLRIALLRNRIFSAYGLHGGDVSLPGRTPAPAARRPPLLRFLHRLAGTSRTPPCEIRPATRQALHALFARHNAGLEDLTGLPLRQRWPSMQCASPAAPKQTGT